MAVRYVYLRNDYPTKTALQMEQIKSCQYDKVVVESRDLSDHSQLQMLLREFKEGDTLIVPDVRVIALNLKSLMDFLVTLEAKQVRFISLIDQVDSEGTLTFYQVVHYLSQLISEQERLGFFKEMDVKKRCKVGRPRIDKRIVREIQNFYFVEGMTMREISDLTNVSLGTVYKYIHTTQEKKKSG